jgi:tripartite-type tricarboxylate transporter receptor subunit TctC
MSRQWIAIFALLAGTAAAADYPARPVHIVVPNPPGGTVDLVARTVANGITPALGQPVVVEIKNGGNNIIGSDAVARAKPDGYTLLMAGTHLTINPLLRKLPYDGLKAFTPIALLATTPNVIAVHASMEVRTLGELIALARAKPGQVNCATSNLGSGIHLAAERFKSLAGVDINYVPYQGGVQAVLGVVGGHAPMVIAPLSDAAPHLASGKLRALAVTSLKRVESLPDVPTLDESGFKGFNSVQWFGAVAPAGTPKAAIDRLSEEMLRSVAQPEARAVFAKVGLTPEPLGPAAFGEFLRAESGMFSTVLRDVPVKVE